MGKHTLGLKQTVTISRAFSTMIINESVRIAEKKIKPEDSYEHMLNKIKDIQRKYGLPACISIVPEVIARFKARPRLKVQIATGPKKGKEFEIPLIYKPLKIYLRAEYTKDPKYIYQVLNGDLSLIQQ